MKILINGPPGTSHEVAGLSEVKIVIQMAANDVYIPLYGKRRELIDKDSLI